MSEPVTAQALAAERLIAGRGRVIACGASPMKVALRVEVGNLNGTSVFQAPSTVKDDVNSSSAAVAYPPAPPALIADAFMADPLIMA